MKREFKDKVGKIGGKGVIVEVDESLFGKRKNNKGREVNGVWVFGLVERTQARRIILITVNKRDKITLNDKITEYVEEGTTVYSDKWGGYVDVGRSGFIHSTVNHSTNFVDPTTGTHTQTIEANWSALKSATPKRYRNVKNIGLYLHLFMFRRNWGESFYENLLNLL